MANGITYLKLDGGGEQSLRLFEMFIFAQWLFTERSWVEDAAKVLMERCPEAVHVLSLEPLSAFVEEFNLGRGGVFN